MMGKLPLSHCCLQRVVIPKHDGERGFCRAAHFSRHSPQAMFLLILLQGNKWETHWQSLVVTGREEQFANVY